MRDALTASKRYDEAIAHWRPAFGNENHIRALDAIAEINRLTPQYENLKIRYNKAVADGKRPSHLRLDKLEHELSVLQILALDLIS